MSKFLKLVVENTPSEGRGPFVVEYKDDDGKLSVGGDMID